MTLAQWNLQTAEAKASCTLFRAADAQREREPENAASLVGNVTAMDHAERPRATLVDRGIANEETNRAIRAPRRVLKIGLLEAWADSLFLPAAGFLSAVLRLARPARARFIQSRSVVRSSGPHRYYLSQPDTDKSAVRVIAWRCR